MDALLEILDPLVLDKAYAYVLPRTTPLASSEYSNATYPVSSHIDPDSFFYSEAEFASAWGRDHLYRQISSCLIIAGFGAAFLYTLFSAFSYYLIYDRRLEYHPRFLKNQIRQEIISSFIAIPVIDVLTLPFFLGEVRGHSLLYSNIDDYGWPWLVVSTLIYMMFNDLGIYWIHRLEHHPSIYKYIHKPHHKWISKSSLPLSLGEEAVVVRDLTALLQFLPHGHLLLSTLLTDGPSLSHTSKLPNGPPRYS
jgi:lathosterol oxidase